MWMDNAKPFRGLFTFRGLSALYNSAPLLLYSTSRLAVSSFCLFGRHSVQRMHAHDGTGTVTKLLCSVMANACLTIG